MQIRASVLGTSCPYLILFLSVHSEHTSTSRHKQTAASSQIPRYNLLCTGIPSLALQQSQPVKLRNIRLSLYLQIVPGYQMLLPSHMEREK